MKGDEMARAKGLLRDYFGYSGFLEGQEEAIRELLDGGDVLAVMPTGAGKSVCYQIPALMLPGITVVISPLISLMKDQVDGLRRMGVPVELLNSSISQREADMVFRALADGGVKLLYIAPERLESEGFVAFLAGLEISMVAVDEAHCVSQWGHDFRPSYRRIRDMVEALPHRPGVGAFTATATQRVSEDILSLLGLIDPYVLNTGFDRANLHLAVYSPPDRERYVVDYLRANAGASGIIYCLTRKSVDKLCGQLAAEGLSALPYHAGLSDEARRKNQDAFRSDRVDVIVATNAFGMGIDKSNVRFVLHYGMPKTLESYYQEAGRAGRDGEKSDCVLLYHPQDIITNRFLIESSGDGKDKSDDYGKLRQIIDYCNTDACLRSYILRYFGADSVTESCGNCSGCDGGSEKTDITVEAQKIISCVRRMGNRFGSRIVAQVLRGSDTERIRSLGFDKLSTYGIMREYPENTIKEIISLLTARGYLEVSGNEYPVLIAGDKAMRFLREKGTLSMKRAPKARGRQVSQAVSEHGELFERLRALRKDIAERLNIAPYIVLSDASLAGMCALLPRNRNEMILVPGVGKYKLSQYGDEFIRAVEEYITERGIESPARKDTRQKQNRTPVKGDTVTATFELYKQGKSLEEIATIRGLTQMTIESHLIKALHAGLPVDPEPFVPEEQRSMILSAIERQGTRLLKPIKEALPDDVTYTSIRFALELYRRRQPSVD